MLKTGHLTGCGGAHKSPVKNKLHYKVVIYKIKTAKETHINLIVANFLLDMTSQRMRIATAQRKGENILESRSTHLLECKTQVINNT